MATAQGNGIGAAQAVGGEVLREEQSGAGRQCEQNPTGIPVPLNRMMPA